MAQSTSFSDGELFPPCKRLWDTLQTQFEREKYMAKIWEITEMGLRPVWCLGIPPSQCGPCGDGVLPWPSGLKPQREPKICVFHVFSFYQYWPVGNVFRMRFQGSVGILIVYLCRSDTCSGLLPYYPISHQGSSDRIVLGRSRYQEACRRDTWGGFSPYLSACWQDHLQRFPLGKFQQNRPRRVPLFQQACRRDTWGGLTPQLSAAWQDHLRMFLSGKFRQDRPWTVPLLGSLMKIT